MTDLSFTLTRLSRSRVRIAFTTSAADMYSLVVVSGLIVQQGIVDGETDRSVDVAWYDGEAKVVTVVESDEEITEPREPEPFRTPMVVWAPVDTALGYRVMVGGREVHVRRHETGRTDPYETRVPWRNRLAQGFTAIEVHAQDARGNLSPHHEEQVYAYQERAPIASLVISGTGPYTLTIGV